jgi:molybdate transport system permease protein
MDLQALWLTVRLATATTLVLMASGIPLAWWLASTRARWRPLVEAVTTLPLLLPPTVLGFYLLVLLGPRTGPGRVASRLLGHPPAFSFSGLVIGSVLYSLPFAVQPLAAGFRSVDIALIEQAQLLGAGRFRTLTAILLPLSTHSVVAAAVLCFTHTVGEFGVVLMIGGDIPGATRTLSIAIYDQGQSNFTLTALLLGSRARAALHAQGQDGNSPCLTSAFDIDRGDSLSKRNSLCITSGQSSLAPRARERARFCASLQAWCSRVQAESGSTPEPCSTQPAASLFLRDGAR